jgi:hypothetical protein
LALATVEWIKEILEFRDDLAERLVIVFSDGRNTLLEEPNAQDYWVEMTSVSKVSVAA